jgi:hypothetical protein
MDNLSDYIKWMGDLPFSAYPLNDADALVLSFLAYYDFTPLFAERDQAVYLRDSLGMLDAGEVRVMLVGRDRGFREILEAAARSRRFGDLRMSDYVDLRRAEPPLQFAALTFHGEDFSFLAFRGTDGSLAGWKEDFMISFTITEAQELARSYAQRVLDEDGCYYIGGHSKGGNLALYAACELPARQWNRVRRLYLLDSPGLCAEVMETDCIGRIDSKTTRIVPTFSVVGKLFEPSISDSRIVYSTAMGFVQHSLDTWGIDHGKLALAQEASPRSRWINETLSRWIGGISQEDRAVFVQELFAALSANGAETLEDIETGGASGFESILASLFKASSVTKRTITDLPKRAILGDYYDEITQMSLSGWLMKRFQDWQAQHTVRRAELPEDEKDGDRT